MRQHPKAYLALLFICIVWGTTYLAIRMAVLVFPAFLFAAIRQFISGAILIAISLLLSKKTDLSKKNLLHQAFIGFLLITVGNGLVSWGERQVPSGISALICSLMPMIAVLVNLVISKKEKINAIIISGMLLGFFGVGLIFKDDVTAMTNKAYIIGIIATLLATSSWAIGSVMNKKRNATVNPLFNAGLQLLFGGSFLFLFSPIIDDYSHINLMQQNVLFPLSYLIIFGSIFAYTAYMYALKELPVGIVTLYAYVNPLVAVILGYWILNEPLTWFTFLAFTSIVSGVYLVKFGYQKQHKTANNKTMVNTVNMVTAIHQTKVYK